MENKFFVNEQNTIKDYLRTQRFALITVVGGLCSSIGHMVNVWYALFIISGILAFLLGCVWYERRMFAHLFSSQKHGREAMKTTAEEMVGRYTRWSCFSSLLSVLAVGTIACVLVVACIDEPFLVALVLAAIAVGTVVGGIIAYGNFVRVRSTLESIAFS